MYSILAAPTYGAVSRIATFRTQQEAKDYLSAHNVDLNTGFVIPEGYTDIDEKPNGLISAVNYHYIITTKEADRFFESYTPPVFPQPGNPGADDIRIFLRHGQTITLKRATLTGTEGKLHGKFLEKGDIYFTGRQYSLLLYIVDHVDLERGLVVPTIGFGYPLHECVGVNLLPS